MRWDGSAVIADSGIGASLTSASQAGRIGVYETGIYDNNRFGPNDKITREQTVTIIYRYTKNRDPGISSHANLSQFTDAQKISNWAQNAMEWAVGIGLISGRSPTTLVPQGEMTRAEVAQMLKDYH